MRYAVSFYANKYDTSPDEKSLNWDLLAEGLANNREAVDKETKLWSPVSFQHKQKQRAAEFVHSISCLVLDFDTGLDPSDFMESWGAFSYVVHSTFSNKPDYPKWRAVFPLIKPVMAADWDRVYSKLALALGHGATDPSCTDKARMYFVPSHPKGVEPFYFRNDAALLDPSDFPDIEEAAPEEMRAYSGRIRPGDDYENEITWEALLEPRGFRKCRDGYRGQTLWTRPDKKSGASCKTGPGPLGERFYSWSSSIPGIPPNKPLTKFALLAHFDYNGDFKACADALRSKGYGKAEFAPSVVSEMPSGELKRFNLTDLGNAERFCYIHGPNLRYVSQWGKWAVWDGRRWKIDDTGSTVYQLAQDVVKGMQREAVDSKDSEAKELGIWAFKCESRSRIDNIVALARHQRGIPIVPDDLDQHPYLVNVANGTFDMKTGEKRGHAKEDLLTKLIDIPYNDASECPTWITFLLRCMDDSEELVDFLWRAIGYSLVGTVPGEKCFFFLHGDRGNNGKSTFIETLMDIFGDYACATNTEMLAIQKNPGSIPNDLAQLKAMRFVTAQETADGMRLDEQKIKKITGGDKINARFLHQEFFNFTPQFRLWFSGNHKPVIRGTDDAIWDRVVMIPFAVHIPENERDPELKEKLLAEREGILGWMIDGCLEWRKERLKRPALISEAVATYRSEMDVLGEFLSACVVADPNESVGATKLYERYTKWSKDSGEFTVSQRRFGQAMTERGTGSRKAKSGMVYDGMTLIEEDGNDNVYRGSSD